MRRRLVILLVLVAAGRPMLPQDVSGGRQAQDRRQSIQETMDEILLECQSSAGGDWRKWFDNLALYRQQLAKVMEHESRFNVRKSQLTNDQNVANADPQKAHHPTPFLTAEGKPPLLASFFAGYYVNPPAADPFQWGQQVSSIAAIHATQKWLQTKGIDLIIVPVPTVLDIYPERVVTGAPVPENRIIQPQVRKVFYDLLKSDVELVDLLPRFLEARKRIPEPLLYLPGDIHWGPPAWKITADALAKRLRRYPFVQTALKQSSLYVSKRMSLPVTDPPTRLWEYLSTSERQAIRPYLRPEYDSISRADKKSPDAETSPVVILGDSFSPMIAMQLAKEINLPVAVHSVDGASVQPLKELLRTPNGLSETRVVIWVASYATYLLMDWNGLPDVVLKTAGLPAPGPTIESLGPSTGAIEERTEHTTLPSGMKVALYSRKTRGATVAAVINLHYGTADSLANQGMASQFVPQMLLRGTKMYSQAQIEEKLKNLQATVSITGSGSTSVVNIETVRDKLAPVLAIVSDALRSPQFSEGDFLLFRESKIASFKKNMGEPQVLAINALSRHLYPYAPGDIREVVSTEQQLANIQNLTLEDVTKFYKQFFGGSNAEMSVVGDFDRDEIHKVVADLLGDWRSSSPYREIERPYVKIPAETRTIETPGKKSAVLAAGQRLNLAENDPDYPAVLLGTRLVGGGRGSRLAKRIREKDHLDYAVVSNFGVSSRERGGLFMVLALNTSGSAAELSQVESDLKDELTLALRDGFSANEVAEEKAAWRLNEQSNRQQDATLARKLAANASTGRTLSWDSELEKKILALSPSQIRDALRKYLSVSELSIVKAADFQKSVAPAQ